MIIWPAAGLISLPTSQHPCHAGVWFNSEATFYPSNVASTEVIDRHTPNSEVCMANGYSSMVFDERVFVSFNP